MNRADNILHLLEDIAGRRPCRGILIDLPEGLDRDVTQYSDYLSILKDLQTSHPSLQGWEGAKPRPTLDSINRKQANCHDECYPEGYIAEKDWYELAKYSMNFLSPGVWEDLVKFRKHPPEWMPYDIMLRLVYAESRIIGRLMAINEANVILLYTDNDMDGIHWFWTIVCAGGIPCLCTKLPEDAALRTKQILNLKQILKDPLILTSKNLKAQFQDIEGLKLWTFGQVDQNRDQILHPCRRDATKHVNTSGKLGYPGQRKQPESLAILMLTSGSTGNPKAVCLTHHQIICSLKGKKDLHQTSYRDRFMNWTGLDHVAHLIEIHLHAIYVGANQFTLPTAAVLSDPPLFLKKISEHRITYTFAPNFFLALLVQKFPTFSQLFPPPNDALELSRLRALISGGEANLVETCKHLTKYLMPYGAPIAFIRPGFGMTETCAGSIYNAQDCPVYDVQQGHHFASLGVCIPGMDIRFSADGELQLRGNVVFQKYYNNEEDSALAFTEDGWFKTGDIGCLDKRGYLHLTGREKDLIIVNGVNHQPQAIESAIENANVPSITPTFTTVFGVRRPRSNTESLIVVYLPKEQSADANTRVAVSTLISKAVVISCGVRPHMIIPLDDCKLQKSSIGKISRSKLRKSYEAGEFNKYIQEDSKISSGFTSSTYQTAGTMTEKAVLQVFADRFGTVGQSIGINQDLFELGASSLDILGIKVDLQKSLNLKDIPVTTFFSNPILSDLATALDKMPENSVSPDSPEIQDTMSEAEKLRAYDPIVALNPNGTKTPIFFIHPGVGEVMIFMNISRYFTDRPVYALRARGFNGEPFHTSFNDIVNTYLAAIRRIQPKGPYLFVGYSFGSIVAFEMTKYLQGIGQEVEFLATIDQPPLFKARAKSYDWYECVLTLSFFLGLMDEKKAYAVLPIMRQHQHDEVLDHIFEQAPKARLQELGMDREKLDNWAKLALQLKKCVSHWDPMGKVKHMDVFYTGPLIGLVKATNIKEWLEEHLMVWNEYVEEGGAKYHEVGGTHRTLISPPHLVGFWKVFKKAMDERGL